APVRCRLRPAARGMSRTLCPTTPTETSTMSDFNRRRFLEGTAGIAAGATLGASAIWAPAVHAQTLSFKPEKGAKLRVLRWSRFVQGDIDQFMKNVAAFTAKT